jgi:hypothetical protein
MDLNQNENNISPREITRYFRGKVTAYYSGYSRSAEMLNAARIELK